MNEATATATENEPLEYVSLYVPASVKAQLKALENEETFNEELIAYVERTRKDFRQEIESIDEDVLMFKARLATAKNAFQNAYATYADENYQLWERTEKNIQGTKDFVALAVKTLEPLKRELSEVNTLFNSISRWDIEKFVSLLEQLGGASSQSTQMLRFLFENFKYPEALSTTASTTTEEKGNTDSTT